MHLLPTSGMYMVFSQGVCSCLKRPVLYVFEYVSYWLPTLTANKYYLTTNTVLSTSNLLAFRVFGLQNNVFVITLISMVN